MRDLVELHRQALAAVRPVVAGLGPDQLAGPTPCAGWDVRTLLNHLVSGNLWAAELAAGATIEEVGDRLDGDVVGTDPLAAWDASAAAADRAFSAPGAMEAPCAVSYGPVPGEVYAGHRFVDVVVHGWDLAAATGQDTTLDPALVEACWDVLTPQLDLLQGSGMFGRASAAPDGADRQAQLLAALGRS
jgi:uncharacterized protein (TIGR03086 family)